MRHSRFMALLLLALPVAGCASGFGRETTPLTASVTFAPADFEASTGRYSRFPLASLDRNLDPESGNKDDATSFPEPGVIRLAGVNACSVAPRGKPDLCATRNEIRTARGSFNQPAFYRIGVRLAAAGGRHQ